MSKEVAEEYASSLADLTVNSKPLINMLTILAEENIDHAGVIVETVEKHLEKVHPDIKLPVLYLVDSIIKNVGGAYTVKFSQIIVNMFTRTFKQVDEKIRSQMFKLRETWHDVFPASKLYQLDVKVSLIDPAWPIQAHPQQSNIHVNPSFLKKTVATTSAASAVPEDDEKMRSILAKKEKELLMLQRKKVEMELEQMRKQVEIAEKVVKNPQTVSTPGPANMPVAMVNPVAIAPLPVAVPEVNNIPVKQRLGPPVNKPSGGRIAPVSSGLLASVRRDPRLARRAPPALRVAPAAPLAAPAPLLATSAAVPLVPTAPLATIPPNLFDIKPLERVTKRKNVITIDVQPDGDTPRSPVRDIRRRDPRLDKRDPRRVRLRDEREQRREEKKEEMDKTEEKLEPSPMPAYDTYRFPDPKKISKLPPIPKINRDEAPAPPKRKRESTRTERRRRRDEVSKEVERPAKEFERPTKEFERPAKDLERPAKELNGPTKEFERPVKEFERPIKEFDRSAKEIERPAKEIERPAKEIERSAKEIERSAKEIERPAKEVERPAKEIERTAKEIEKPSKEFERPAKVLERSAKELERPAKELERPVKEMTNNTSSEKKSKKELRAKKEARERREPVVEEAKSESEVVAFKELRNFNKDRYRHNRDKSESPETRAEPPAEPPNVPDIIVENKDVDLRVLHAVVPETKPALVSQKRSSTEAIESKAKKNKIDKFDILFGNEDVDLRKLPQVEEVIAPPPPSISGSPKSDKIDEDDLMISPISLRGSPKQKDWNEVKSRSDEVKKTPSNLDLVRAKLAEATKSKDGLGRPLLFNKSSSIERERRRTLSGDDSDPNQVRVEDQEDFDENKKSISIIMSQAKEHLNSGQLDKNQYNLLMYQVLQLNEKLKLKEAKQRESLEVSKRKLKAHTLEENQKVASPKSSPNERNKFGDIDERITPLVFADMLLDSQGLRDSDMRISSDSIDGHKANKTLLPLPPMMPMLPLPPMWRGQPRPRVEEYGPRRFRGPAPQFNFRSKFDKRVPRPTFESMMPLPMPTLGMCQVECPLQPYERIHSPPPLGAPGYAIPPTDMQVIEYIDQDPFKTIQIDGVPREIRFYGDTAIIMLDWDDPREIKFLPGCRRVTFDNKDSVVVHFNEGYKQVEIDDQIFNIKFGAPTRELYINGRWFESFFGGQPLGVIIDGKPRLVHLEGPMPQVDIGKTKRTDLVAGKINLIINATQIFPVYLDAKVQKILVNGKFLTIRFVDSLRTVLINEQPFKVEFGDLPKPIVIGCEKYFIRFSALPRNVKPGHIQITNMEGTGLPVVPFKQIEEVKEDNCIIMDTEPIQRPIKTPSPEGNSENFGLDMLASVMPSSVVPASNSEYSLAEPLFAKPDKIPGLETPSEEKPANPLLPILGNLNVNDLFAKLVATGIVSVPKDNTEKKEEPKVEEVKPKPKEDKNVIHRVDLLKPETLRVKQAGLVTKLYGGMQCSGCGTRFPPEHTVRYSQHLDWHFRQNRRDRDSARRAHSRHWHYDLSDWVQYEEVEDLEEREKSWFETGGLANGTGAAGGADADASAEAEAEAPSAAASAPARQACALCGDAFQQFYNEDKEEWHLRNSLKHDDDYYHPLCFEDYKASLAKKDPVENDDVVIEQKLEEPIEIKDVDESMEDQSDNESVVEVVEPEVEPESVEIDEGEEDDVVFNAVPVEEVVVDDDVDTDDETTEKRAQRDRQAEIDYSKVKVKQEPVDPDDEPVITAEEESVPTTIESTHTTNTVESSIDGNVQLDAANHPSTTIPLGGIRINISKSLPTFITPQDDKMLEDISADDEPLPPGEEPELEYSLKPALEGVQLSRQPPTQKGNELSGLCSIM